MLAPESVHVPASCLVRVPAPVPMIEVMLPPDVPPKVSAYAPEMVPTLLIAMVPVPPTIEDALPKVIRPA